MTRLISGVALAAAALAAILFLPVVGLRILACIVAAVAAFEYLGIVRGSRGADGTAALIPPLLLVMATCWWMLTAGPITILVLILLGLGWVAAEGLFTGDGLERAALSFLAPWYIGMPLGMLVGIQAVGGRAATLLLLAAIVVSDTAQYYSGRLLGRRALAPAISPKKTIEGALGGLACGSLFMFLAGPRAVPFAAASTLALLGAALVTLGICGDLFESRLKRAAGMKDSSTLIPGHGGMLDRIDALLFATPAFYLYLTRLT